MSIPERQAVHHTPASPTDDIAPKDADASKRPGQASPSGNEDAQTATIHDIPPHRTRDFTDLTHAVAALLVMAAVLLIAAYLNGMTKGVETDARNAGQALNWLMDVPTTMLQQLTAVCIVLSVLIQILMNREWLHSVVSIIALLSGYACCALLSVGLHATGSINLISALASNGTGASPMSLLPDIYAGLGAFLTVAGPRRIHSTVRWGWNTLYIVAAILVIVSWHSVPGVLVSFALARVIGMLIRFAAGSENKGIWGKHLVEALHGIGIDVASLARRIDANSDNAVIQTCVDDDLIERLLAR